MPSGGGEWPVAIRVGEQEVWGQIDLLLETADGVIVVDFKTFEGSPSDAAAQFGAQVAWYLKAVVAATGKPARGHVDLSGHDGACSMSRGHEKALQWPLVETASSFWSGQKEEASLRDFVPGEKLPVPGLVPAA